MRHCALCGLDEHTEEGFLEGEAQVRRGDGGVGWRVVRWCTVGVEVFPGKGVDGGEDAAEGAVHAFYGVWEVEEDFPSGDG